jgi:hypothetical protein
LVPFPSSLDMRFVEFEAPEVVDFLVTYCLHSAENTSRLAVTDLRTVDLNSTVI